MKQIQIDELLDIVQYEKQRNDYRKDIINYKKDRRFFLGPQISVTFEDRKTLKFQIQEMMRAERMIHDDKIQAEIDVYNTLMPEVNQLSATLFIEITEEEKIKEDLHKFIGLTDGDKLWIQLGEEKIFAKFEAGRSEEDKISSVHYIKFDFSPKQVELLAQSTLPTSLMIAHNNYKYFAEVSSTSKKMMAAEMAQ